MTEITGGELVLLIREGISATPQCYSQNSIDSLLLDANRGRIVASTASPETQLLAKAMSKYRGLILDTAFEKLLACDIISIPIPLCNAKSRVKKGESLIIIFDGLLDVAVAYIEMSHVVRALPGILDETFPKAEFPNISTKSWIAIIFSSLINCFLTHGEPLPDFRALITSATTKADVEHAFLGTAWWTLLHELGHISLGHARLSEAHSRFTVSGELVINESISEFQHQEFEADAFVYNCLTDLGKQAFYSWTNFALGPVMMIETLTSKSKDTHPLSINRINRAYELSNHVDSMAVELKAKEHLLRHGKAHLNIQSDHSFIRSKGGKPIFADWSREDLFIALNGLRDFFLCAKIDIDAFIDSKSGGWRSLF